MSLNLHLKFSYLKDSAIGTSHVIICILTEMIMEDIETLCKLLHWSCFYICHISL